MGVTVNSTTDDVPAMEEAVTMYGNELVSSNGPMPQGEEAESEGSVHVESTKAKRGERSALEATENLPESGPKVASTTDTWDEIEEVQQDLNQDREEKKQAYLGKSARRRIDKLTRERYEQKAEIEAQKAEIEALRRQNEERQQYSNTDQQSQQLAAERHWIEAQATLPYRIQEAKERYPDIEQVVSQATEVVPVEVLHAIQTMPDGFDVGYYLCKHPEHARQITQAFSQGRPDQAGAILDYISNGLRFHQQRDNSSAQQPGRRQPPAPPPPIRPVGATSRSTVPADEMPYQDYKRIMNERERRGR